MRLNDCLGGWVAHSADTALRPGSPGPLAQREIFLFFAFLASCRESIAGLGNMQDPSGRGGEIGFGGGLGAKDSA